MDALEALDGALTPPSLGASAAVLPGTATAIVVGGVQTGGGGGQTPPLLLRIQCYDIALGAWAPSRYCNTNGVANRCYHSSASLGPASVYVFGGCTDMEKEQCANDVVRLTENEFGVNAAVEVTHECVARVGQTACAVGKDKKLALLYGGAAWQETSLPRKKCYHSDLWIFQGNSAVEGGHAFFQVDLQPGEAEPAARAHHSVAVLGDVNQFVLVFGGEAAGGVLLGDLWLLDLTATLAGADGLLGKPSADPAPAADAKGKDAKKPPPAKKGQPTSSATAARWTQIKLPVSSPTAALPFSPRRLHSCVFSPTDGRSGELVVFGGAGENGPLSAGLARLRVEVSADGKPAVSEVAAETATDDMEEEQKADGGAATAMAVFGAATTIFYESVGDAADPAPPGEMKATAALVFGGQFFHADGALPLAPIAAPSHIIVIDATSDVATRHRGGAAAGPPVLIGDDSAPVTDDIQEETEGPLGITYTYEGAKGDGGARHGFGRLYSSATGLVYEGHWSHNEYHGTGKLTLENGDVYEGLFERGEQTGAGRLTTAEGAEVTGTFKNGIIAAGTATNMSLVRGGSCVGLYSGGLVDGLPSGPQGTCEYTDGATYTGAWRSGKRNGEGRWVGTLLEEYTGKFVGDKKSGRGRFVWASGEYFDGIWLYDAMVRGERRYADGSIYVGEFKNSKRSGDGDLILADGSRCSGTFLDDILLVD